MNGGLTPAAAGASGVAVVLFGTALALGRPDIAVLPAVLLVAVAVAFARGRPRKEPEAVLQEFGREPDPPASYGARTDGVSEPGASLHVRMAVSAPDAEFVIVEVTVLEFAVHRIVLAAGSAGFGITVPVVHSGVFEVVSVTVRQASADAAWVSEPSAPVTTRTRVDPPLRKLRHLPLPASPGGLVGTHNARRPGDGGEFHDIHPFTPGDRLRRIDWKATARLGRRPGDLYVRRSYATADVDVAFVLDDGDDVNGMLSDWVRGDRSRLLPSSMDVAREAAWSLAAAYLATADQVSFQTLSRVGDAVGRGSGARQRERVRVAIDGTQVRPRYTRTRTPLVAPGALVVLLSTYLDDEPVRLATLWRAAGHRVLAVDTLPRLLTDRMSRAEFVAARVVLGERADRLDDVRAVGADVLVWDASAGERSAVLRELSRPRRRR